MDPSNEEAPQIILSARDRKLKEDTTYSKPSPIYYTGVNFIIDQTSRIYFHNKTVPYSCSRSFIEPPLVHLEKDDLVELGYNDLKSHIDSIYALFEPSKWKFVQIASTSDTVNLTSFEALKEVMRIENRFARTLRRATDEEMTVLKSM